MKNSIRKFKNGKLKLTFDYKNCYNDNYYNTINYFVESELEEKQGLYVNRINGYNYLVDTENTRCYEVSTVQNLDSFLLEELIEGKGIMYLYPLSKKESKSLIQDLENGY